MFQGAAAAGVAEDHRGSDEETTGEPKKGHVRSQPGQHPLQSEFEIKV